MRVVRNGAFLQLENVMRLLERGTRWQVRGRVEAGRRSIRRLVNLSKHVSECGGGLKVSWTSQSGGVGFILGCLQADVPVAQGNGDDRNPRERNV